MLEKYLIEHCSPTLASVKSASLFHAIFREDEDMEGQLGTWGKLMESKGIRLLVLQQRGRHALVYVYREKLLQQILDHPRTQSFLAGYGYTDFHTGEALAFLQKKFTVLSKSSVHEAFPHEIGVFLDYPLDDVIGFIENNGKNYLCMGCWKVYCNQCEAMKQFQKYRKCKEVYCGLWKKGQSVLQLTVAA